VEQVTIWLGEMFTPLVVSTMAIKVIREVESQFANSSSFSSPRTVPAGRSRISSICKRNSSRVILEWYEMIIADLAETGLFFFCALRSGVLRLRREQRVPYRTETGKNLNFRKKRAVTGSLKTNPVETEPVGAWRINAALGEEDRLIR
jgi:hypothetical protein